MGKRLPAIAIVVKFLLNSLIGGLESTFMCIPYEEGPGFAIGCTGRCSSWSGFR